jgi:hypothetical protein
MHRFSIACLLAMVLSFPANGQLWDYIVTSESGNRYYIDPLSIQRKGSIVNYIQLINYPQGTDMSVKGMLSFVQFKTNDCAYHRFNISRLIGYEYENAKGSVVTVEFAKEEKWLAINPKKIAHIIHQEVCNYKY